MFNSEDKVLEIIKDCKEQIENGTNLGQLTYAINLQELLFICEDFIIYKDKSSEDRYQISQLEEFIRLLRKENQELKNKVVDNGNND